jgi:hypothetical protein
MKRLLAVALAFAFGFVGTAALAQSQTKTHEESTAKYKGPGPNTKMKTESVTGTVKEYEPGKKIVVTGPKNKDYSFDLSENAKVEGSIAVGSTAKVEYLKGVDGKENVTVLSEAKAHHEAMHGSASPSTAKSAEAKPPAGGSMATETTTKYKGPGPNTKVKTETVIGTVKDYQPGKKIVVVGPKDKDYSFDLDENAGVSGDIAPGKKVKVSYTKTDSGQKVTTVAPYSAKKKSKKAA